MTVLPHHQKLSVLLHRHHGRGAVMVDIIPVGFVTICQNMVLINGQNHALVGLFPVKKLHRRQFLFCLPHVFCLTLLLFCSLLMSCHIHALLVACVRSLDNGISQAVFLKHCHRVDGGTAR